MRNFQLVTNSGVDPEEAKTAMFAGFRSIMTIPLCVPARHAIDTYFVYVDKPHGYMGAMHDVKLYPVRLENAESGLVVAVAFMNGDDL